MSLSSLLAAAEADVAKANPVSIIKAALAEIEELKAEGAVLKADVQAFRATLVAAQPALRSVLNVLYPGGAGIPAELLELLDMLSKTTTEPANKG